MFRLVVTLIVGYFTYTFAPTLGAFMFQTAFMGVSWRILATFVAMVLTHKAMK